MKESRRPTKDVLESLYIDQRLTTREIGSRFGVAHISIRRWLSQYEIPVRPKGRGLANRGLTPPTRDELVDLIHTHHLPHEEIARQFGVSQPMASRWIRDLGIEQPPRWTQRRRGDDPVLPDKATLRSLYIDDGIPLREIGAMHGVGERLIRDLAREFGIPIKRDGFNGGQRFLCKDGHLVRSSYELRVDNWLHSHGVVHDLEPRLPFDRRYCADFLANGWYIEIWGVSHNPSYQSRKQRKRALYLENGLPLIELSIWSFCATSGYTWEPRLSRVLEPITQVHGSTPLEARQNQPELR